MEENNKEEKVDLSQLRDLDFAPNWNDKTNKVKNNNSKDIPKQRDRHREFKGKQKELPSRYENSFTNKFKITVSADKKILDTLKKEIRRSGISYSLEEINRTIIDKKNRLQITIENLTEHDNFFTTKFDNSIFSTKPSAIKHIVNKGLKHVVNITETIGENPSGNFKNILKCTKTDVLLPPKSFHDFESVIKTHLIENRIGLSYDKYVDSLQIVEDELTITEWKNEPLKILSYETKELNNKKRFNKIEAVAGYISSTESEKFIQSSKIIKIKGDNIDRFEKKLNDFMCDFLNTSYKWKKDLFFNILINFKKSGFYIFKYGPKKYLFASAQNPKSIEVEKLSKNCVKIVELIQSDKPTRILHILSQSEKLKLEKKQILTELKWLVKEGYIKEFSDGTIAC